MTAQDDKPYFLTFGDPLGELDAICHIGFLRRGIWRTACRIIVLPGSSLGHPAHLATSCPVSRGLCSTCASGYSTFTKQFPAMTGLKFPKGNSSSVRPPDDYFGSESLFQ